MEDIIAVNFHNLRKETDIQFLEAHRVPNRTNPKRNTPRQIVIKMTKIKEREYLM